jgi:hypothetical protein
MVECKDCRDARAAKVASWSAGESFIAGKLPKCSSTGSEMADKEYISEDMTSGGAGVETGGVRSDLVEGERCLAELEGGLKERSGRGCHGSAATPDIVSMSISDNSVRAPVPHLQGEIKMANRHVNESENTTVLRRTRSSARRDRKGGEKSRVEILPVVEARVGTRLSSVARTSKQ